MKITIKVKIDKTTGLWYVKTTSKDPYWANGNTISSVPKYVESGVKYEMEKKNLLTKNK